MKSLINRNILLLAGIGFGAIAGFLYWKFAGCSSGTCPITSNWHISTMYGALMGGLGFSLFKKTAE